MFSFFVVFLLFFCLFFFPRVFLHFRRSRSSGHLRKKKTNNAKTKAEKTNKQKTKKTVKKQIICFFSFCFFLKKNRFGLFLLFSSNWGLDSVLLLFYFSNSLEVGLRHFTQFAQDEHAETCAVGSSVSTRWVSLINSQIMTTTWTDCQRMVVSIAERPVQYL